MHLTGEMEDVGVSGLMAFDYYFISSRLCKMWVDKEKVICQHVFVGDVLEFYHQPYLLSKPST